MILIMTTYNRFEVLEQCIQSFLKTDFKKDTKLYLFDDCSEKEVKKYLFKSLSNIKNLTVSFIFNTKNLGCNVNVFNSLKYVFELTNEEFVFVIDSDAVFNKNWLKKIDELIEKTKNDKIGCIGLFDTNKHQIKQKYDDELNEKVHIGGFCIAINRKIFFNQKMQIRDWDWKLSEICNEEKYKILCTNKSYIQHLGHSTGTHMKGDVAINFIGED
jgi:GT2 family glycosyltransferase